MHDIFAGHCEVAQRLALRLGLPLGLLLIEELRGGRSAALERRREWPFSPNSV